MTQDDYTQLGDEIVQMHKILSESYENAMGTTKVKRIKKNSRQIVFATVPPYITGNWEVSNFNVDCKTVRASKEFHCLACGLSLEANEFAYRVKYSVDPEKWKSKSRHSYWIPNNSQYTYIWFCYDCGEIWLTDDITAVGEFGIMGWERDSYSWGDPRQQKQNKILKDYTCIICNKELEKSNSRKRSYESTYHMNGAYIMINDSSFVRHTNPLLCWCSENDPSKGKKT